MSMQEFSAAMDRARVTGESGTALTTEYGVAVSAGAALDEAKGVARGILNGSSAASRTQWGISSNGEDSAAVSAVADKLVEAAFDKGLRSLSIEQANVALDGMHQGVATAALSLAVNDLQEAQVSAGPLALASNNPESTLQVLEMVASRMADTRLSGVQSVEGLQPTLLALAEVEAPTAGQVDALRSVGRLEFKATATFNALDADSEQLSEFVQEVRDLSATMKLAFGERADEVASGLESFADAIDRGDVGQAQEAFAHALQGGRDLAAKTLSDFVSSGDAALSEAQVRLDDFAPSAADGMERFVALVIEAGRDNEDVGSTIAAVNANLAAVLDAARERGDTFVADLESLSSFRDGALVALAQRTMAADARQAGGAVSPSVDSGWTSFDDAFEQKQTAEGPTQEKDRGEAQAEMEMEL